MGAWGAGEGVVELPDGLRVRGRSLREPVFGSGREAPEFGICLSLLRPRPTAWESRWVRWPDFAPPLSTANAVDAIIEARARAVTERVEVACGGGTGRTGTALAVMAVLSGVPASQAVAWVRQHYRTGAVETILQRRWIRHAVPARGR